MEKLRGARLLMAFAIMMLIGCLIASLPYLILKAYGLI